MLSENNCQEPPHTWRTSSILLRFLMVILMAGVILTEPEVSVDVDADAELRNKAALWSSEKS